MIELSRLILALIACCCFTTCATAQDTRKLDDAFEQFVRPVLADNCIGCHGAKKQEASLRLDSREALLKGGDSGPAVIVGKPGESRLIEVVEWREDDTQMPPKGKLKDQQIQILRKWIELGVHWPKGGTTIKDSEAWRKHWAFQKLANPEPPAVRNPNWCKTPIDRFVLARLEAAKLAGARVADSRALVRRLHFDLIGLPPTFEAVEQFRSAPTEAAYEKLVDELLASQHFGERWARHWMDVSRYSDTTGYVFTKERKISDAYKYRDWLVHSFNSDMPIRDFLIRQVAADFAVTNKQQDQLNATGFITLGRRFLNNKHDIIDDRIDVVTRGMMGLTVSCARCHDHKFDPIPTADYYSLYGVFASTKETGLRLADAKMFNPYVFVRGQAGRRGQRVPRQFLSAVSSDRKPFPKKESGRRQLASAITDATNPLTARVFVNRVWGHLFGSHLVDTPSDFGVRSNPPTPPKLLDHLASSLVRDQWSMKRLIKRIAMSSSYRQTSNRAFIASDPANTLLSRMNRKRLQFEPHRDSLLDVAGQLDRTIGGKSVKLESDPPPRRRAVYAYIDRQNLPGLFRSFDLASPDTHAPKRYQTTVPQQALFQLNNPLVMSCASGLARRSKGDDIARLRQLYRFALSREPSDEEIAAATEFISVATANNGTALAGWEYGHGKFDTATKSVKGFTRYAVFAKNRWQGADKLPGPITGWSSLTAEGGHSGHKGFSAIRRWTAPSDGTLTVFGQLTHLSDKGDGVVGRIISSRQGVLFEGPTLNKMIPALVRKTEVKAGDVIDFVLSCGETDSFDSFKWTAKVLLRTNGKSERWDSKKDFESKQHAPLDAWARYAQVLMLSNEFVFVD